MNDSALIEYIRQSVPGLITLYRFGSQAKGTARPDSDIDLAVLARDPIPNLQRFELAQELAIHDEVGQQFPATYLLSLRSSPQEHYDLSRHRASAESSSTCESLCCPATAE